MKISVSLILMLGLVCMIQLGCSDDDTEGGETPMDTGTAEPGDTADAGSGGMDTGTGAGGGGDLITASEDGWIDGSNPWGIIGAWYTYDDNESCDADDPTICGTSQIEGSVSDTGGYCAVGEGAQVTDSMYSVFWGAGIGFNTCLDDGGTSDDQTDDVQNTLSACSTPQTNIVGFRLTVNASVEPTELRVTFSEAGREESTYIEVTEYGVPVDYLFENGSVAYDGSAPPVDVTQINALQFQVATNTSAAVPFDFCIENISAIVAK